MAEKTKIIFGLVGKKLSHSFSKTYFTEKFKKAGLKNYEYLNFELDRISEFPDLIRRSAGLCGLNITVPYKESVIPYLDALDDTAKEVGAVNTVKILRKNGIIRTIGYNTDIYGFERSLTNFIPHTKFNALILGTGGAAKATAYVLKKLKIDFYFVSREKKGSNILNYSQLTEQVISKHLLIVNATPVGMYPVTDECPPIPYEFITPLHFLFDLIYNPPETLFLKKGKQQGAQTKNGLEMLRLQAEKAWEIWNE